MAFVWLKFLAFDCRRLCGGLQKANCATQSVLKFTFDSNDPSGNGLGKKAFNPEDSAPTIREIPRLLNSAICLRTAGLFVEDRSQDGDQTNLWLRRCRCGFYQGDRHHTCLVRVIARHILVWFFRADNPVNPLNIRGNWFVFLALIGVVGTVLFGENRKR